MDATAVVPGDSGACSASSPSADAWQASAAIAAPYVEACKVSTYPAGSQALSDAATSSAPDASSSAATFATPPAVSPATPPAAPSQPQRRPPPAPGRWPPPLQILRSSQADAVRLDAELGGMLQEQMAKLFEHFSPGHAAELEPEMGALLSLMVFLLSVWPGRATPGSELLNLRYRNERAVAANPKLLGTSGVEGPGLSRPQRIVLGLGTVLLPYAWSRLGRAAHAGDWADAARGSVLRGAAKAMRWAEGAMAAAALANSWAFLVRGDYRSLLERLVGARLVWRQATMTRIISFEYLNRQLLWQQTAEALLLLLPMVDLQRLRRAAMRLLPRPPVEEVPTTGTRVAQPQPEAERPPVQGHAAPEALEGKVTDQQGQLEPAERDQLEASQEQQEGEPGAQAGPQSPAPAHAAVQAGPCPLCGTDEPLTAVVALPCRHAFCYYCLRSNTAADPWFACPRDGVRVAAMRRVGRQRHR